MYKKLFSFQNIRNNAKRVMCDMWEVIKNQIFAFDNVNVIDLTELLNQFEKLKKKLNRSL